ncbi:MAG: hypothetical protein QW728_05630 [Thermoplasmata archaeon]
MNVSGIIRELMERDVIGGMPKEYIISQREKEYEEFVFRIDPYIERVEDLDIGDERDTDAPNKRVPFPYTVILTGKYHSYWNTLDKESSENRNNTNYLPEIDLGRIEEEVARDGIEALAWYRSFHWHPPERWGIYILNWGIFYLTQRVFAKAAPSSTGVVVTLDNLQQGFRLLFLHEFFHYITDIAASTLEIGSPRPVRPYYIAYTNKVYKYPKNKDEPLEEALANAYAYNRIYGYVIRRRIADFMKRQPSGYSAFEKYWRKKDFAYGRRLLGTYIRDGAYSQNDVLPLEILFDIYRRDLAFTDVPLYIVNTPRAPPLKVVPSRKMPLVSGTAGY